MEAIVRRVDSLPTLSGQVGRVVGFFVQSGNSLPFVGVEAIHQTHAAIYEERIVDLSGLLRDFSGRSVCKLITRTQLLGLDHSDHWDDWHHSPRVIIDLNLARVVGSRHSVSLIRKSVGGRTGPPCDSPLHCVTQAFSVSLHVRWS